MIIQLAGRKRSGKSTVADYLVAQYGFTKLSYADPIREMLLELDPVVRQLGGPVSNLVDLVEKHGWEWAKRYIVETRSLLQNLGMAIRKRDEDWFCWNLEQRIEELADGFSTNIVIDDCRFENEARWFKEAAGLDHVASEMWRIERPGYIVNDSHESEAGVDPELVDHDIYNNGTVEDLLVQAGLRLASARGLL